MLYTKIQPQSFLGSGEEDFYMFFITFGHGGHLVQWFKIIGTNCQYPFNRMPHVKSWKTGQTVSEKTFKDDMSFCTYI